MKLKKYILGITCVLAGIVIQAQENEVVIPFDKGVISICSSKNFKIKGYKGSEVIIKSVNSVKFRTSGVGYSYFIDSLSDKTAPVAYARAVRDFQTQKHSGQKLKAQLLKKAVIEKEKNKQVDVQPSAGLAKVATGYLYRSDTTGNLQTGYIMPFKFFNSQKRSEGLKKLGKANSNRDKGIFLTIEQKGNELIIKDDLEPFMTMSNETYELLVPNDLKLVWNSGNCDQKKQRLFYTSKSWELQDFKGEVEISSSLNNLHLTDVVGPVSINTIGANVTVEFIKDIPKQLYSIYSNNGFVDITFPENSNIAVDAKGSEIFSDLPFKIDSEENNGSQHLEMKLNRGNVKVLIDAGLGSVFLRKKS